MACITLLSDFGSASGYPAAMKGVILSLSPSAQIVDISHDVERHHIRAGAFLLWMVAPYFPEGTVHCAVVDPGVGSSRRPLAIESGGQFFVGPDNGLLIPAAERLGKPKVHHIQNEKYLRARSLADVSRAGYLRPGRRSYRCGTPHRGAWPTDHRLCKAFVWGGPAAQGGSLRARSSILTPSAT
jgi:hypothetical protein